jgi:FAD synthetase
LTSADSAARSASKVHAWLRSSPPDAREAEARRQIAAALDVIRSVFQDFPRDSELSLAFNGGKDCLVVLHLVLTVAHDLKRPLPSVVYFDKPDEFEEMFAFMETCERDMSFSVRKLVHKDFKMNLAALVDEGVKAVFMGQRRTDPNAPKTTVAESTPGWPKVLRINPILDCTYETVWSFLVGCDFAYCSLYDQGYTSLGSKSETKRNPVLAGQEIYRKASELTDGDAYERDGRSVSR